MLLLVFAVLSTQCTKGDTHLNSDNGGQKERHVAWLALSHIDYFPVDNARSDK